MDFHVRRLREACDILTEAGIRVGLEYVSAVTRRAGHRHTFIYDLSGCMRLIDSVGRENLGVVLDSFHWYCAGESVADIAALTDAQVVNVHVNDAIANRPISDQVVGERELPGTTGVINITAFMRGLSQIGYQGPVTCEPMNAALKALSVDQAVAAVNAAMDKIIAPGSEVPGSRVS
jgi:sugar phosphate isomerase/epimerase